MVSIWTRLPRCRLGAVGSKPHVEGDRPGGERLAQRVQVGGLGDQAAPLQVVEDVVGWPSRCALGRPRRVRPGRSVQPAGAAVRRRRGTCGAVRRDARLAASQNRQGCVAPSPATPTRGPVRDLGPAARRRSMQQPQRTRGLGRVRAVVAARRRRAPRSAGPGRGPGRASAAPTWRAGPAPAARPPTTSPARSSTARPALRAADQVHAPVHAVGEVDVDVPGGPNITALRGVRPRNACEPGSCSPSYASTSVSRTATTPSPVGARTTAPSRSGATSSTGRSSRTSAGGQQAPVPRLSPGPPRRRARAAASTQRGELLGDPRRRGAAVRRAGRPARRGRTAPPDVGREVRRRPRPARRRSSSHSSTSCSSHQPHQPPGDLVRLAERRRPAHQPLGDVGGQREARGRGVGHPLRRRPAASRPCRPAPAAPAAACRPASKTGSLSSCRSRL